MCASTITRTKLLTPQKAKARFLQANDEDMGAPSNCVVFVDSLTFKHTVPHQAGDKFEASSPNSPFKGKSVKECSALLKQLSEATGAFILNTTFAIFDERSLEDGSVLLVQTVDDELEAMRAVPELVCGKLLQYMIGDSEITEDREEAEEEEDGVFWMNEDFIED